MLNENIIINLKPSCVSVAEKYIDIDRIDSQYYDTSVMDLVGKIEGKFRMCRAEELFEVITDGDHGSRQYVVSGVPFYTAINVQEEGFEAKTELFIDKEYEKTLRRSRIEPNSLLVVKTGVGTGVACVTGESIKGGNISADVGIFKSPRYGVCPYYISAFMNSSSGRRYILRSSYGSTRNRLTINELKNLKLPLISHKLQQYIGNKVRKAEELRAEAKQFRIKSEGKLNQAFDFKLFENIKKCKSLFDWVNTDYVCTDRVDADYFMAEYLEIERLFIENKGRFQKLNDIVKLSKSRVNLVNYVYSFLYLDISSLNEETGIFDKTEVPVGEAPNRAQKRVQTNDVLVSTVRPNRKGIGLVTKDFDDQIASTGFAVLSTKDFETDPFFLYLLLGTDLVTKQLIRLTSGGLYPAISEDELMNIFIPIIDNESQKEIGIGIKTYFENLIRSKLLIAEAKQDVEDLIEGKFDESKISEGA